MFLDEFFQTLLQEIRQFFDDNLSMGGPTDRLRKQLRIMYGRGELRREVFFQLRSRLDQGQFIEGELQSLHRQAVLRMEAEGRLPGRPLDLEINRNLERVYISRAMLEEARVEMLRGLKIVEQERRWMAEQAGDMRARAQAALPDESTARALLDIRQRLLDHQEVLGRRVGGVQEDLRRIDLLEAQLRLYESELMILESRERLAHVELAMNKHLLP